mgnify:CR=1 FL=1
MLKKNLEITFLLILIWNIYSYDRQRRRISLPDFLSFDFNFRLTQAKHESLMGQKKISSSHRKIVKSKNVTHFSDRTKR